jgi:hypothetical protein
MRQALWWKLDFDREWLVAREGIRRDWDEVKRHGSKLSLWEVIPPNACFEDNEEAVRFGFGARRSFQGREWDHQLEQELRQSWGRDYDYFRRAIRRGWVAAGLRGLPVGSELDTGSA